MYQRKHRRVRRQTVHWQCQRWARKSGGKSVLPQPKCALAKHMLKLQTRLRKNTSQPRFGRDTQNWILCILSWSTGHILRCSLVDRDWIECKCNWSFDAQKIIWGVAISALELSGLRMKMKWTKPDKRFCNLTDWDWTFHTLEHNLTIYQSIKVRCQSSTSITTTSVMTCRQRPSSSLGWLILGHLRRKEFLLWRAWAAPLLRMRV